MGIFASPLCMRQYGTVPSGEEERECSLLHTSGKQGNVDKILPVFLLKGSAKDVAPTVK